MKLPNIKQQKFKHTMHQEHDFYVIMLYMNNPPKNYSLYFDLKFVSLIESNTLRFGISSFMEWA